ncbi:MAG: translation initiation factor IF-2 [Patescibacteria group bacterium]
MAESRPPIVGIFGHIDHGKSTLLDYIRKTNLTEKEAGGITQHISAYEITRPDGKRMTFIDTPGHEAFASVRTRGASAADIAVLVVSGEDGVRPQTLEVYKYIKENALPFIVAITKMDKPGADLDRTKQNLAENEIYIEGYGGNISCVPLSAKTGQDVDELLDIISLQAEILDLKGEPEELGSGVIIESRLDAKRGIAATGIIKNGTVRRGTFVASGGAIAPIRILLDAMGEAADELPPSSPVQIIGWDKMPPIGREFKTFLKKEEALAYVSSQKNAGLNLHDMKIQNLNTEGVVALPLIIKADTAGSADAIENELRKLSRERIIPKVIVSGVGSVNENDVKTALATPGAVILSFNAKVDAPARALSERSNIKIFPFSIIYELTGKVAELLSEREPRVETEEVAGTAKVLKLFSTAKGKQILGARVTSGSITRGAIVKIVRREAEIGKGRIKELQQAKSQVDSVSEGGEFGAMIESKMEAVPGDMLQAVMLVTK